MSVGLSRCSGLPASPCVYVGGCWTSQISSRVSGVRSAVNLFIASQVGWYSTRPSVRMCGSIAGLQNHHHHRVVAQFLVERVELFARSGAYGAGQADVARVLAGAHLHAGGCEAGIVLGDDLQHGLREASLLLPEYLQRKVAGVFDQAVSQIAFGCFVHLRITSLLKS